ncbi:hypothetical protein [Hymenobacter glaciei]|uniref:hypothetical protein n=1 Tax=Hymenobacter glaciei TaxID=877209 RepID=UPI0031E8281A
MVFFLKQLDGPLARWVGYIYCPALKRPFFVNEQRMVKGATQPVLGAVVDFKEGATQEGKEFAAASSVRESVTSYDSAEPLISLDTIASIYRLTPQLIRARIENKFPSLHEEGGEILVSIAQIKALASWSTNSISVKKTEAKPLGPPDDQLRFGQLVRHEFDRGFGFVKEQGKGKAEFFAHVKTLKFEPNLNDWLVFAVGADGRVSWARKPAQALPWLRRSYTTFSVAALDELFQLGEQELAEEVLAFRIERILTAKAEAHVPNGEGLLEKVQRFLPQNLSYAYERLIVDLEGIGKLRLWGRFGNAADAPFFIATLDDAYQRTLNQQAAEMPREEMLGLLDLGRQQANAEAVVQAWWPTHKIEGMAEAERVEACISLFKWLREWYEFLSVCDLTPSGRTSCMERWRVLSNALRAHFALVGGVKLGASIYEANGMLLPVPELVQEKADQLPKSVLLELVRDGGEVGYLALGVALRRLGNVDTEVKYESLREWLNRIKPLQTDNPEWMKSVMVAVDKACSSVYRLNLWNAGFLPDLDWQEITGCLEIESARIVAFDGNNKDILRLAAAHRVINLELLDSTTAYSYVLNFLNQLSGKYPVNIRVVWNPNGWKWQKAPLNQASFAALVKSILDGGDTQLQHYLWRAGAIETPAYGHIYDEINRCADGFDRSSDEAAWIPGHELIKSLNETGRLAFLDWMLNKGHIKQVSGWNDKLLHSWLTNLPDTQEKQETWNRLLTALTTPAMLKLWLADVVEHYDFEAYRLLVFTLPPADQILFLRKTFKLLAAEDLQLTANQLNGIVRYSRSELGGGPALDYSLDLALTVLNLLAKDGALPTEKDIVEVVCRYIREDTTSLTLIGKALFAPCLGRSEVEKKRAPSKDVVKGRIGEIEYPASTDKKTVFVDGVALSVVDNKVELFGDAWPVSWNVKFGYDYSPGDNNIDLKPAAISLCEGRLAYKPDTDSQLPIWWCCNRPCFKPNQDGRATEDWQQFTLVDFINILKLPFDAHAYYSFVGLINRVNRLLTRLQCRCCNHILRPVGQSDFNFYRANRFRCTNRECEIKGIEVYLSHCLNGYCMSVIDSRDSSRCSYRTEGSPDKEGMYVCANCGGCCSKQALVRRKENLEKVYPPEMLTTHAQYHLIAENLAKRLYHWERMRVFCYKCTKPMQQRHQQANYTCSDCKVEYGRDVVHIEVARRKSLTEEDA